MRHEEPATLNLYRETDSLRPHLFKTTHKKKRKKEQVEKGFYKAVLHMEKHTKKILNLIVTNFHYALCYDNEWSLAATSLIYNKIAGTQEEAAEAYDIAAIKFRGVNAVTNFDITRYDVERIMASNTLIAGELARKNKEIGPGNEGTNQNPPGNSHKAVIHQDNGSNTDWKMVMYQSSQQADHQHKAHTLSLTQDNVSGMDTMGSSVQQEMENAAKINGTHVSNACSLVTSLSSSREGSPDRNSRSILFSIPPTRLFNNAVGSANSWNIPAAAAAQVRPAISMPQMPVFAAWTDG